MVKSMSRKLNKKQKKLINNFLDEVNDEQKWLSEVSFDSGIRTQHFSKPKVEWKEIPNDTRDKIIKLNDFETIYSEAQVYIDETQGKDLIVIDRGGQSEHVSI